MRPSLRHQLGERRRTRRTRGAHRPDPAPEVPAAVREPEPDSVAQQVRDAGGPTDHALYACQCGYLFAALVSTTVQCPHCGTSQAW